MYAGYKFDTLAKALGHDFLRLPPYHCEFNPIELFWSQVKECVAANNSALKFDDLEKLLLARIDMVSELNWKRDFAHFERTENESWDSADKIDDIIKSLVIELGSDSKTSS